MIPDPTSPLGTADGQREGAAVALEFVFAKGSNVDKHLTAAEAQARAQLAIALELADIAMSLRMLAGRPRDPEDYE